MIEPVYINSCPNCGGPIEASRALAGVPCSKCIPHISLDHIRSLNYEDRVKLIYNILIENGTLKLFSNIYYSLENARELYSYFTKIVGREPWSLQKLWLRRLIDGKSFSMTAPTGMGKTTTLIVYSSFMGKDVLYIVPTRSLMEQVCKKFPKETSLECGEVRKDYINVVTFAYINKNFDKIKDYRPKLIIVDDADAVIKSGKITDKIVNLLGISMEDYINAIKLVKLKRNYIVYKDNDIGKELLKEIEEIESKLSKIRLSGQLVVASATLRPKGVKQLALRYLTGFELSTAQIYARNVIDAYSDFNKFEDILSSLGSGGLVFFSKEYSSKMKEIKEKIEGLGLRVEIAKSGKRFLDRLSRGEVDIILGSASYYGIAIRGIDEPRRIKYAIFYGVPKNRIKIDDAVTNPIQLIKIRSALSLEKDTLEYKVMRLTVPEIQLLKSSFKSSEIKLTPKLSEIKSIMEEYIAEVKERIRGIDKLVSENIVIYRDGKEVYVVYPDIITYLQGSGRTSRLLYNGLTLGISIVLVDDIDIFNLFKKKLGKILENIKIYDINELELDSIKEKLERSREGELSDERRRFNVRTALMIVESPTKARTIAKLFGRASRRQIGNLNVYETMVIDNNNIWVLNIVASKGHLFDLTLRDLGIYGVEVKNDKVSPIYENIHKCRNCGRSYSITLDKCPHCNSERVVSSLGIVNAIRILASEVDEVYIATDPDIEGEKIAYDIAVIVSPFNPNIYRLKYNEVTKHGVVNGLRNLQKIDMNIVHSQIFRRIEDRWIGFSLSNYLKSEFNEANHGAGRVQTPVLRIIYERTKEYKEKMGWIVIIPIGNYVLRKYFREKEKAQKLVSSYVIVNKLGENKDILLPPPPFTTDTLLEEAYRVLGFPGTMTMKIAQDLFEMGLITYHRTDSIRVSTQGISIARSYLEKKNLIDLFVGREWSKEGTHEAIRPTTTMDTEELKSNILDFSYAARLTKSHLMLYDLIFKRFIASQMKLSEVIIGKFEVKLGDDEKEIIEVPIKAHGGFITIYPIKTYEIPLGEIKVDVKIKRGSQVTLHDYSSIIREMKQRSLGRPSTYVSTIKNLLRHGYVVESKRRSFLISTKKGEDVLKILESKFHDLISETRTVNMLKIMDMISVGKVKVEDAIYELINELNSNLENFNGNARGLINSTYSYEDI